MNRFNLSVRSHTGAYGHTGVYIVDGEGQPIDQHTLPPPVLSRLVAAITESQGDATLEHTAQHLHQFMSTQMPEWYLGSVIIQKLHFDAPVIDVGDYVRQCASAA